MTGQRKVDFEPIGLYGFDPQRLMEAGTAYFHVSVPKSGRGIGLRGDMEDVHAIHTTDGDLFRVELATRIEDLYRNGMILRDTFFAIFHHEGHMEGVTRPPYAALAVDEAFQSAFSLFAANVEAAKHVFLPIHESEVAFLLVRSGGHEGEGLIFRLDFGKAIVVGLCAADGLQLEVVSRHFYAR